MRWVQRTGRTLMMRRMRFEVCLDFQVPEDVRDKQWKD